MLGFIEFLTDLVLIRSSAKTVAKVLNDENSVHGGDAQLNDPNCQAAQSDSRNPEAKKLNQSSQPTPPKGG